MELMPTAHRWYRTPRRLDVNAIRQGLSDPAAAYVHGKPLVYLDNAATTQKPQAVIDRAGALLRRGERQHPSRRARAERAARPTPTRPRARRVRQFLNAADAREIVFVRGTTEAHQPRRADATAARTSAPGDEIVISEMEHHSNIVPWQIALREERAPACASSRSPTRASCGSTSTSGCSDRTRVSWR